MASKLNRYVSQPAGFSNQAYVGDGKQATTDPSEQEIPARRRPNFLTQFSVKAQEKLDVSENQITQVAEMMKRPNFQRIFSLSEVNENDISQGPIVIESKITKDDIKNSGYASHRDVKPGSQRFRWNLVFNLLLWIIVPLPFWLPSASNNVAIYMIPAMQGVFAMIWAVMSLLGLKNSMILLLNRYRNFAEDYDEQEAKRIRHIVAISCYKEPEELITRSVQTVAEQTEVRRITMVIGFEEGTPNREEKCRSLEKKFRNAGFERIIFTIHPRGLPNEIPGKCSNSNYCLRMAVAQMGIPEEEYKYVLVTTCDADSKFPPQYIAALTSKYIREDYPALNTIYQAPLFYNWRLDSLSFVTRVTGILRSLLMLGALIPFNINTMSIFSFSLSLAKAGNFVHPAYQMDDIICLIRWMGVTRQRLRIRMLPVPVLSGPTSGETIEIEIIEWARQARRWTIGAAEVFHYYAVKAARMPIGAATSWGIVFIIYYGVLLCTSGLFGLTSLISMIVLVKNIPPAVSYVMYAFAAVQMASFGIAFIIDIYIPRIMGVKEHICIVRNIFHYITTPFVLLGYSIVEFYALHEIMILGRKVCKHGASKKGIL